MHCVSKYPAKLSESNLNIIKTLAKHFDFPVGLSDHTMDPIIAPMASVVLGAKVIEKHITLNRSDDGPDQAFSIEPSELNLMIKSIRGAEVSLGISEKKYFLLK